MKPYYTTILFRLACILSILTFSCNSIYCTSLTVSGDISSDQVWSSDTIFIDGNITILEGVTLTIDPGIVVSFKNYYGIVVNGRLLATGTRADTIMFTANDTTGFTEQNHIGWAGIEVNNSGIDDTTIIQYCKFQYARNSLLYINSNKCQILNCTISNNDIQYSTYLKWCLIKLTKSVIFNDNLISNNYGQGSLLDIVNHETIDEPLRLYRNNFYNNDVDSIIFSNYYLEIINSIVKNNKGDISGRYYSRIYFINCLFIDNYTPFLAILCDINLINCTLDHRNTCYTVDGALGLVYFNNSIIIGDCFSLNYASQGGVYFSNIVTPDNLPYPNTPSGYYRALNIIVRDPVFSDVENENYKLEASSPCINNGDNSFVRTLFDMTGNPRIANDTVDIGAYEFQNHVPERIYDIPDQIVNEDESFQYTIPDRSYEDNDPGDSLIFSANLDRCSNWLSFNKETQTFDGNPKYSDIGTFQISIKVSDIMGYYVQDTFVIEVKHINHPPELLYPIPDMSTFEDLLFSYTIPDSIFFDFDIDDNLIYVACLPNNEPLPGWLNFNSTHKTLYGIPSNNDINIFSVIISAIDNTMASVNDTIRFEVTNINDPPFISNPLPDQIIFVDSLFQFTIPDNTFTDVDPGDSFFYTISGIDNTPLPSWLSYSSYTKTLSGIPKYEDTVTISIKATDQQNATVEELIKILIVRYTYTGKVTYTLPEKDISVYPNPGPGKIKVNLNRNGTGCQLKLYNLNGISIRSLKFNDSGIIEMNDLPKGLFIIIIHDNKRIILKDKIIIN